MGKVVPIPAGPGRGPKFFLNRTGTKIFLTGTGTKICFWTRSGLRPKTFSHRDRDWDQKWLVPLMSICFLHFSLVYVVYSTCASFIHSWQVGTGVWITVVWSELIFTPIHPHSHTHTLTLTHTLILTPSLSPTPSYPHPHPQPDTHPNFFLRNTIFSKSLFSAVFFNLILFFCYCLYKCELQILSIL
jgi:hypothetical protein